MSKKNTSLPLPLQLVKDYDSSFKGCWDMAEYMLEGKGKDLPEWSDLCYLPLAAAKEIMRAKWGRLLGDKLVDMASLYAALASWRQYKEIYTFSAELAEDLERQGGDDIVIPVEILYNIPYPCIYVSIEGDDSQGFFVFFNQNIETKEMELRFCYVSQKADARLDVNNLWLHLHEGYTISDGIRAGLDAIKKRFGTVKTWQNTPEGYKELGEKETEQYMYDIISKSIQLVLYICAENAEIDENPRQKQITQKRREGVKPKDVYREIQKWDVGVKYAYSVRKHNAEGASTTKEKSSESAISRSAPRPHTRRGHWHHYWTGSRSDNSRKLILKWTAPTFVGNADDTITTIQKLK